MYDTFKPFVAHLSANLGGDVRPDSLFSLTPFEIIVGVPPDVSNSSCIETLKENNAEPVGDSIPVIEEVGKEVSVDPLDVSGTGHG